MASLVTGAAGAAIGSAFGPAGAQWGWAIGSSLGSMLFSSAPDQEGPRLNDLQIQDSSYGKPIPIVYGRDRLAGNIIWSKPLEEVKNEEEQGKGSGPTTTTYNYFATFALGLCEGEILGVRRIWLDSKLIYKFTEDATVEELLASNALIDGITIYTGSESQEPDPLIQAHKGIANTPAFRGLAYLVFDRLDVGNSGRIPNINVEVVASGSAAARGFISSARHSYTDFSNSVSSERASAPFKFRDGVVTVQIYTTANSEAEAETELEHPTEVRYADIDINGNEVALYSPYSAGEYLYHPYTDINISSADAYNAEISAGSSIERAALIDGDWVWVDERPQIGSSASGWALFWGRPFDAQGAGRFTTGARANLEELLIDAGASGEYIICATGSTRWQGGDFLYVFTAPSYSISNFNANKYYLFELVGDALEITETGTVSGMTHNNWFAYSLYSPGLGGSTATYKKDLVWGAYTNIANNRVMVNYITKSGTAMTVSSSLGGYTISAQSYNRTGLVANDGVAVVLGISSAAYVDMFFLSAEQVITTDPPALSSIVSDLCTRAGLSAGDIDVTALTDTVRGYTVTRPMSARSAIQPLMLAYFFDGGEYSNKLNFIKRGGSVVTTIPEVDLGVDSEDLFKQTRQQEAELPSEVIFNYKDVNRDFQPGSQRSRRINTNVENVQQVDLAIALTANQSKRKCEVNHYNSWVERDKFEIQVTDEYLSLNPTNVIQFTENSRTRKGRIVDISYGPMMKIEMVAESGNYSSDAVAGESESVDQTLGIAGPTNLQLLDIPLLRNQDNDTAIYLAASGYYNGWAGCRVYKSTDDISFSEVDALFNSTTQGQTTTVLADASHTVWDRASTVTVRLPANQSLSSSTESNVLKGANPALIGSEIIHFVNATDNGDGTWTLDTLLRGRRGTDWATDTHAASERFVLLDESKMGRIEAVLNTTRYFKGVSIGNYLVNAESESFSNTGISLKPFSPTFIRGSRDGSNNLTITWINRSRYIGGALQPLPLFEESRIYKVEILDALGGSALRTLSPNPTTESDTYSAADQVTDGFTAGDPIPVRVSQYSATLGAFGYAKEAIV